VWTSADHLSTAYSIGVPHQLLTRGKQPGTLCTAQQQSGMSYYAQPKGPHPVQGFKCDTRVHCWSKYKENNTGINRPCMNRVNPFVHGTMYTWPRAWQPGPCTSHVTARLHGRLATRGSMDYVCLAKIETNDDNTKSCCGCDVLCCAGRSHCPCRQPDHPRPHDPQRTPRDKVRLALPSPGPSKLWNQG
jgi:hypothetical protein